MYRRRFIGAAFAQLGITGLSAKPPRPRVGDIPMRVFGKTGVKLTVIGQGGSRMDLFHNKVEAREHLQHVYELGINYFDCAHSYWGGWSEEVYGDVLSEVRKEVFITTKSDKRSRKEAEDELHLSLRRLKTDYIDLWQMHDVRTKEDVVRIFGPGGAIEAFESAKKAGKCRFFGFTGHYDPNIHLEMLKAYDKWDSILMPLHAADPSYLSFEKTVLPTAIERGIGIQGMKNFCKGFLLRALSPRDCLRYVLSLPAHCTVVGCGTRGQVEDNIRTAQTFQPLRNEETEALRSKAVRGLGVLRGPALEYWKKGYPPKNYPTPL
jgi:predicted aldo/keto reductase-like oxidoreductase